MPQNKLLVDSGFRYALYDRDDEHNEPVSAVAELYRGQFIIPHVEKLLNFYRTVEDINRERITALKI